MVIYGDDDISMLWGNVTYSACEKSAKIQPYCFPQGNCISVRAVKSTTERLLRRYQNISQRLPHIKVAKQLA